MASPESPDTPEIVLLEEQEGESETLLSSHIAPSRSDSLSDLQPSPPSPSSSLAVLLVVRDHVERPRVSTHSSSDDEEDDDDDDDDDDDEDDTENDEGFDSSAPITPYHRKVQKTIFIMKVSSFTTIVVGFLILTSLGAALFLDWDRKCNSPLKLWASALIILSIIAIITKITVLLKLPSERSSLEFQETRLKKMGNWIACSRVNNSIYIVISIIGAIWIFSALSIEDCQARTLVTVGGFFVASTMIGCGLMILVCFVQCVTIIRAIMQIQPTVSTGSTPPRADLDFRVLSKYTGATKEQVSRSSSLITFKQDDQQQQHFFDSMCTICISDYSEGDEVRVLGCSDFHHFHRQCVDHWFSLNKSCPLCKQDITKLQSSSSSSSSSSASSRDALELIDLKI